MSILLQLIFGFFWGVLLAKAEFTLDDWKTWVMIIGGNFMFAAVLRALLG